MALTDSIMSYSLSIISLGPAIWFLFGIFTLYLYSSYPNKCPNCNNKQTMIPLDTPRAQELIKEHNLTVPTSTIPETNPNPE